MLAFHFMAPITFLFVFYFHHWQQSWTLAKDQKLNEIIFHN